MKHFYKSQKYDSISKEIDGVLHYTGRILPSDKTTIVGKATKVMKDLSSTTFCVPITDRYSPIAFSLVSDIHRVNFHFCWETGLSIFSAQQIING